MPATWKDKWTQPMPTRDILRGRDLLEEEARVLELDTVVGFLTEGNYSEAMTRARLNPEGLAELERSLG